jgi:hypothetical protein
LELLAVVSRADDSLCAEGLLESIPSDNGFTTYPKMRLLAADGATHFISKNAGALTFMVPEYFYTSGAGALTKCYNCGSEPLTPSALSLYLVLLAANDSLRYGGVDPAVLSIRNRRLLVGGLLADWNGDIVVAALDELVGGGFVSRQRSTISAVDEHLLRRGFHARQLGDLNVVIFVVREK